MAVSLGLLLAALAHAGSASADEPACASRLDCSHGLACRAGKCVPPECASDAQCGAGHYCDTAGDCQSNTGVSTTPNGAPPPAGAAASDEPPSRFYWHEALGVGVLAAQSSYTNGTRAFTSATVEVSTTLGVRIAPPIAVGGSLDVFFVPPTTVVEERSLGHKEIEAPFGIEGVLGPSAALILGRLRLGFTPGFFWSFLAPSALGGTGFGATVAGAYDLPVGRRLALGFEARGLAGAYGNSDSTHTGGWSAGATLLVGLRSR